MKRIILILALVPMWAAAADMHWCEKANGVGGNYPICPEGYAQKDGREYVAPVDFGPLKVRIGMTDSVAEATDYPWGKPLRRNRTTNARGVREQWVYSGNRYLYFENGILTTISE